MILLQAIWFQQLSFIRSFLFLVILFRKKCEMKVKSKICSLHYAAFLTSIIIICCIRSISASTIILALFPRHNLNPVISWPYPVGQVTTFLALLAADTNLYSRKPVSK